MKKMLKRADGSKSQRGLWDNIRAKAAANKKAGKKGKAPSEAMLEQEAKINAEMKMGGDWMQSSKELKFGGPTKYQTGKFKLVGSPGGSAGKQACIGESCKGVVAGGTSYAGGSNSGTNYTGKGAQGLSNKPKIDRSRIVEKSEETLVAEQAYRDKQAANKAENDAKRQAARDANLAAYKAATEKKEAPTNYIGNPRDLNYSPVNTDFKRIYAVESGVKKTGGKRKSNKK
jgi:hypothetical protein